MSRKFKKPSSVRKTKGAAPPVKIGPGAPANMDRVHLTLNKLIAGKDFKSAGEANAYLNKLMASGELDRMINAEPETPQEKAQELAARAMEASTSREALKLARQALELDPDCADALMAAAMNERLTDQEYIARLREAVAAGERVLGRAYFEENRGHFWGLVETRPYMRARFQLALTLANQGRWPEAAREFEQMLDLNPGDNQGVRYRLIGTYLATDDLVGVDRLLKSYPDDSSATFAWGSVLRWLLANNSRRALRALHEALRQNPHVLEILGGVRKLPRGEPRFYSPGDPDEAASTIHELAPALLAHPDLSERMARLLTELLPPQQRGSLALGVENPRPKGL